MTPTTTFIRNIRGDRELEQPGETARELMDILAAVDGKASIDELAARLTHRGRSSLEKGLEVLVAGKFIRDAAGSIPYGEPGFVDRRQSGSGGQADQQRRAEDLRAKLKARREGADRLAPGAGTAEGSGPAPAPAPASGGAAEQSRKATEDLSRVAAEAQARRAAEEQSRKLVEEQARRAAEDLARRAAEDAARRAAEDAARRAAEEQARKAAEEQARKAAEEQARKVAEEQARKLAEAQARKAAEDAARRAAEEQARKLAEEQARKLAVEQARKAAEDAARKAAEEKARQEEEAEAREAAERARQRAEVQARLMAEEKAWQEAEEKARRDEEAKLREQAAAAEIKAAGPRRPRKLGPAVAMAVVALLVLGLAAIHLLSFDAQIPPLEQALSAQFQQPVKIRSLHMALLPSPHMRLEGVAIGAQGQVRIAKVKAAGDLGNLFNEKKAFRSVELDSAAIGEEALGWILFDGRQPGAIPFGRISATNATLDSKRITLPAFDAQVELEGGGAWKTIALVSADKNMELLLTAKPGSALVEAKARSFKLPFGSTLTLEDFVASGTADPAGLNLADFKGFALGGTVAGTARLKWGGSWSLAGNLNVKQIDTARVVPELMASSRLAGTATYAMQGTDPTRLFASTRLDGSFTVVRGALRGIDLGNLLQGGDIRGETRFEELAGSVSRDGGVLQFRQLRLSQANMAATGSIDVSGDGSVQGRVTADIRLSTEQRRASLVVSGNLGRLEWRR